MHQPSFATSTYRSRPKVAERVRLAVLRRDGYRCQRCGAPASEVDHIVGRAGGGGDAMGNLEALCRSCHRTKTGREARAARRS